MSEGNGHSRCPWPKEAIVSNAFYNKADLERLLEGHCKVDSFLRAVQPIPIVDGVWLGSSLLAAIKRTIEAREQRRKKQKPISNKQPHKANIREIKR